MTRQMLQLPRAASVASCLLSQINCAFICLPFARAEAAAEAATEAAAAAAIKNNSTGNMSAAQRGT